LWDHSRWSQVDRARVASSEREFEHERFTVWRCPTCRCIHALEDVDLDRYHRRYGLHDTELDLLERLFYRNKLRFIRRFVDLDPASPMLDLGRGNGSFVDSLRRRGYTDVAGYDPYSAAHADTGVLGRRYRLVLSTDVVEHVPSPAEHLERACDPGRRGRLHLPPDARRPPHRPRPRRIGQPYHRHLVTAAWLAERLVRLGFQPVARTHRFRRAGRASTPTRRNDAGTKVMDHPAPWRTVPAWRQQGRRGAASRAMPFRRTVLEGGSH
jgi:Methyltransferase domain